MSGKLKMDEIAALTGYSVSTVSRVLSGKSYTSDNARDAIVTARAGWAFWTRCPVDGY